MVWVPARMFNPATQIESLPRKLEGNSLCRTTFDLQDVVTERGAQTLVCIQAENPFMLCQRRSEIFLVCVVLPVMDKGLRAQFSSNHHCRILASRVHNNHFIGNP